MNNKGGDESLMEVYQAEVKIVKYIKVASSLSFPDRIAAKDMTKKLFLSSPQWVTNES